MSRQARISPTASNPGSTRPSPPPRRRASAWDPQFGEDWLHNLSAPDAATRSFAAFMLAGTGGKRGEVIIALRARLLDEDDDVAEFAAASLAARGDRQSLSAILERLRTGRPRDRWNSAWALSELGAKSGAHQRREALRSLTAYYRRARGRTRKHAAELLARMRASARAD